MGDHRVYKLMKGSEIVYIGFTSKELAEAVKEHSAAGWEFDSSESVGTVPSEEVARSLYEVQLKEYQAKHEDLPKHNE